MPVIPTVVAALETLLKVAVPEEFSSVSPVINLSVGKVTVTEVEPPFKRRFSTLETSAKFKVELLFSTYKVSVPAPPFNASEAEKVIVVPLVPANGAFNVSLPAPPVMVSVLVVSDLSHAFISC